MARSASDQTKQNNLRKTGANRLLVFRGAVAHDDIDSYSGKDVVYLDLVFSDQLSFRLFSPRESVAKRTSLATTLGALCEAFGIDFNDFPFCFTWEDFSAAFAKFTEPHKRKPVYVKVTLNSGGWPVLGTDRCFSLLNDMEYSDADLLFLDTAEGDLAHPNEVPNPVDVGAPNTPDNDDLPF